MPKKALEWIKEHEYEIESAVGIALVAAIWCKVGFLWGRNKGIRHGAKGVIELLKATDPDAFARLYEFTQKCPNALI